MSPIFWGSVLAVAAGVVLAGVTAWRAPLYGLRRTLGLLGLALVLPFAVVPVVSALLVVVGSYFGEMSGTDVQAQGLLNAMFVELSAGFIAAVYIMPYYAPVVVALALVVVIRHGIARAAQGGEESESEF